MHSITRPCNRQPGEEQPVPGNIAHTLAFTEGEEAYVYLGGRIYEHFTDMKPYMAKSVAQLEKDARVVELRFLLKILRRWHEYNATVDVGQPKTKAERDKWGLSHQLFFDVQVLMHIYIYICVCVCVQCMC